MVSLIGSWGRTKNYKCRMVTTTTTEDVLWNGPIQSKPSLCSEEAVGAYVFHDVSWRQPILSRASLLTLNLIARNQERLQVARALRIAQRFMRLDRVLSIIVDGVYFAPPKRQRDNFMAAVRVRYCDLHKDLREGLLRYDGHLRQRDMASPHEVFKVKDVPEAKYPGGTLALAEHVEPPAHKELEWRVCEEEGDSFIGGWPVLHGAWSSWDGEDRLPQEGRSCASGARAPSQEDVSCARRGAHCRGRHRA